MEIFVRHHPGHRLLGGYASVLVRMLLRRGHVLFIGACPRAVAAKGERI